MLMVCRIFVEKQLSWHTVVTQSHKDSVLRLAKDDSGSILWFKTTEINQDDTCKSIIIKTKDKQLIIQEGTIVGLMHILKVEQNIYQRRLNHIELLQIQ